MASPVPAEVRTPRLSLRLPTSDDVADILRVHCDPLALAHNPGDAVRDQAGAHALLMRWLRHWDQHGIGYWVVRRQDSPAVLGFCGIKIMQLQGRTVSNLFYRLDPAAWGLGVATEAASAAVEQALSHDPACPVVARVRPANLASARVAVKAGLVRAEALDCEGEDGMDQIFVSPGWASGDRDSR